MRNMADVRNMHQLGSWNRIGDVFGLSGKIGAILVATQYLEIDPAQSHPVIEWGQF